MEISYAAVQFGIPNYKEYVKMVNNGWLRHGNSQNQDFHQIIMKVVYRLIIELLL